MRCLVAVLCLVGMPRFAFAEDRWFQEPAAPGQSIGLATKDLQAVESFKASDPVIGTYLFYWYDVYSKAHLIDGDGTDACTTHPSSWDDYSYKSARWWREQLTDIRSAGVDIAAPVYWGSPNDADPQVRRLVPRQRGYCGHLRPIPEREVRLQHIRRGGP
ncbi:MAG: hypothetical protein ACYC3X_29750 [Pirellulaceae bacterium]